MLPTLSMPKNLMLHLRLMNNTSTVKQTFLTKRAQFHLKAADTIVVKAWEVLTELTEEEHQESKRLSYTESSNVKLYRAQTTRETAKWLQFFS
jgi:glycosylphosphatidylinositol transamidase (GPIT) subunit GPI8